MTIVLPETIARRYARWPDDGGVEVQFRLIYRGPLPAESRGGHSRTKIKHAIRREIHRQLAELWKVHPFLQRFLRAQVTVWRMNEATEAPSPYRAAMEAVSFGQSVAAKMASRFAHNGYNFLPLIGVDIFNTASACALDILFLRRDEPGQLVKTGGDIDNRIKVLFDALRMPKIGEFDAETPPAPDEAPFFCLLQDDSLITEIKVTTDRLLTPLQTEEDSDDVHLVIHVRTILIAGNAFPDGGAGNFYAT